MKVNTIIRFIVSIAKLAGISPRDIAYTMKKDRTKSYATELYNELGKH